MVIAGRCIMNLNDKNDDHIEDLFKALTMVNGIKSKVFQVDLGNINLNLDETWNTQKN